MCGGGGGGGGLKSPQPFPLCGPCYGVVEFGSLIKGTGVLIGNGLLYLDRVLILFVSLLSFFVSFPQRRNGIVFSSGMNYLHSD